MPSNINPYNVDGTFPIAGQVMGKTLWYGEGVKNVAL